MKTQKGIAVVEGLLILVIIGLIGGVGWYVWNSQQTSNDSLNAAANTDQTTAFKKKVESQPKPAVVDPYKDWKTYSRYGITWKYPPDWRLKAYNTVQSNTTDLIGKATISITDTTWKYTTGVTADNFEEKNLKNNPNKYYDFKILEINGHKAVQLRWENDSQPFTVFFLPNWKQINFYIQDEKLTTDKEVNSIYNQIVKSVKIN